MNRTNYTASMFGGVYNTRENFSPYGGLGGAGHDVMCILHRSLWLCKKWNLGRGRILMRGHKAICKRALGADTVVLIMKMEK